MIEISFSQISGGFTFPAKRRVIGFCLLLLAGPSLARPEAGPTSQASIDISVSVAPEYRLEASEPTALGWDWATSFCLATNGSPSILPVKIVRPHSGSDRESAEELGWCRSGGRLSGAGIEPDKARGLGLLMIRPE